MDARSTPRCAPVQTQGTWNPGLHHPAMREP
jgi:hypothetical protein